MVMYVNKENIKKVLSIILLIIWMAIIFVFSAESADESAETSGEIIQIFVEQIFEKPTQTQIDLLQPIIRKSAHFVLYTLGGIIICNLFNVYKIKYAKIVSALFGIIYAIIDEVHQSYVPGRSAEIRDILIDAVGIILGIIIVSNIKYIRDRKKDNEE